MLTGDPPFPDLDYLTQIYCAVALNHERLEQHPTYRAERSFALQWGVAVRRWHDEASARPSSTTVRYLLKPSLSQQYFYPRNAAEPEVGLSHYDYDWHYDGGENSDHVDEADDEGDDSDSRDSDEMDFELAEASGDRVSEGRDGCHDSVGRGPSGKFVPAPPTSSVVDTLSKTADTTQPEGVSFAIQLSERPPEHIGHLLIGILR